MDKVGQIGIMCIVMTKELKVVASYNYEVSDQTLTLYIQSMHETCYPATLETMLSGC